MSKYQHQTNLLVVLLLALYLISYAADLTWRLLPEPGMAEVSGSTDSQYGKVITSSNNSINLPALKRLNLFGDPAPKPVVQEQVKDAPKTSLNLTLSGVVASSDPQLATAIIENRGKQEHYGINEKIEGTNARLLEVYADRVIIRNGSRNETLMLDGLDYSKKSARTPPIADNDDRGGRPDPVRPELTDELAEATRALRSQPAEFADYIAITPHQPDGVLEGYRLSPGKNPKLFNAAGFKAGDIVIEINGLDLTDTQQTMEAMNALQQANSLQMVINRGDETLTLYLDIPSMGSDL